MKHSYSGSNICELFNNKYKLNKITSPTDRKYAEAFISGFWAQNSNVAESGYYGDVNRTKNVGTQCAGCLCGDIDFHVIITTACRLRDVLPPTAFLKRDVELTVGTHLFIELSNKSGTDLIEVSTVNADVKMRSLKCNCTAVSKIYFYDQVLTTDTTDYPFGVDSGDERTSPCVVAYVFNGEDSAEVERVFVTETSAYTTSCAYLSLIHCQKWTDKVALHHMGTVVHHMGNVVHHMGNVVHDQSLELQAKDFALRESESRLRDLQFHYQFSQLTLAATRQELALAQTAATVCKMHCGGCSESFIASIMDMSINDVLSILHNNGLT